MSFGSQVIMTIIDTDVSWTRVHVVKHHQKLRTLYFEASLRVHASLISCWSMHIRSPILGIRCIQLDKVRAENDDTNH